MLRCFLSGVGVVAFLMVPPVVAQAALVEDEFEALKIECVDVRGIPVLNVRNDTLNDVAFSDLMRPMGPVFYPLIIMNVKRLQQLSKASQAFFVAHECGHHVLGHLYQRRPGVNVEQEADCYALRTLIRRGWFTFQHIRDVQNDMRKFARASIYHADGPGRASALMDCL